MKFFGYNLEIAFDSGTGGGSIVGIDDNPSAYLDEGNAGVGVCQVLDGNDQCNPSSDDNVTAFTNGSGEVFDEMLGISFGTDMLINSLNFRDAGHGLAFDLLSGGSTAQIAIGDADPVGGTITAGLFDLEGIGNPGGVDGTILGTTLSGGPDPFLLKAGDIMLFTFVNEQFYLSAMDVETVPLPAGVVLMLSGLGVMGVARRRRKAA